jgi:hypothetical protein
MRIIRIISCPLTLRHSLRPAPVIFDVTWTGSATAVVFVSTGLGSMSTVWEEPPTSVEYSLTSESATRGHASQHEASRMCISHHTCGQIVQCCWLARVAALACAKDDGPCAAVLKSRTVRHTRRRYKQDYNQPDPRHYSPSFPASSKNTSVHVTAFYKERSTDGCAATHRSTAYTPHRTARVASSYVMTSDRERKGRRRGGSLDGHTLDAAIPAT